MVPLACMCAKEGTNDNTDAGQVTIKATVDDTKVDFAQGEEQLTLSWSEGDALMVVGNTSEVFTIKPGFSAHEASFEGNAVDGSSFDIFYPASYQSVDALTARSYTNQEQTGNATMAHLEFNALASGLEDYSEVNFGADGVLCNGVLKMVVKLPGTVTEVSSISLSAPSEIFYTTNGTDNKAASLSLGLKDCTIGQDGILTAYMMTSWQDVTIEAGTKLTIEVTAPGKGCTYTKTFSHPNDINLNGGACLNIDIADATVLNHKIKGSGTESDPYLLYDCEDLLCIRPILEENKEQDQYFRLENDIDMSSIENWLPLNDGNIYIQISPDQKREFCGYIHLDGNNMTLSNLKCTNRPYSGFFGVLVGTVKDLTFDKAVISANSSSCGVLGGYIGVSDGRYGKAENITIKNSSVTYSGNGANSAIAFGTAGAADIIGISVQNSSISHSCTDANIFVGSIVGGTKDNCVCNIKDCSCDKNVSVTNENKAKAVGGIVGNIGHAEGEVIENCTFSGTITPGSAINQYVGGIAGIIWKSGSNFSTTVKKCTNNATINAPNCTLVGGIAGYMQKGTITGCINTGAITSKGTTGGIVGQCEKTVNISSSSNTGGITATGGNTGGIVGYFKAGKVDQCWYSGTIKCTDNAGGIVGCFGLSGSTTPVIISNSYSKGAITTENQKIGGIAGESYQYATIQNCYSTMSISGGGRVFGSIAGRFNNGGWNGGGTTDFHMEVTNSIAAGSVNSTATQTNLGSSGAVLGNAPAKVAHYTNCWRIYGFSFNCAYSSGAGLVDQGYTVTTYTAGTWGAGAGGSANWWPYHASEASASALQTAYSGWTTSKTDAQITVSDIASAIRTNDANGWKSDIWDLSGDYPTLKNNPEPVE